MFVVLGQYYFKCTSSKFCILCVLISITEVKDIYLLLLLYTNNPPNQIIEFFGKHKPFFDFHGPQSVLLRIDITTDIMLIRHDLIIKMTVSGITYIKWFRVAKR